MKVTKHVIRDGIEDLSDFNNLYKKYYAFLCLLAEHIVGNKSDAEEIVSDVFVRLWNCRENIIFTSSVKGYLVKSVHNTALNHIEKYKNDRMTESINNVDHQLLAWGSDYPLGHIYEEELLSLLNDGIKTLPCACREIFLLSRNENMKYSEIAEKLGISINTVKTQIKVALGYLRVHLKDYVSILVLFYLPDK